MEQHHWRRLDGRRITRSIQEEVHAALIKETTNGHEMRACIGTDSQVKGTETVFATVVVLVRKNKGAFMYIRHEQVQRKMHLKERMLEEVARSVNIAYTLCNLFSSFSVAMELHADINTHPDFKSQGALQDAMGYIRAMGFTFKAKPHAFASSSCADKAVR
jgi:predicted RNase H-related nuclease YkuK (DUF458 family)